MNARCQVVELGLADLRSENRIHLALARRVVSLSALGGLLIAVSFAISQLMQLMLLPGGPAYGGFYRTRDVLLTAISYSYWNRNTVIVIVGVLVTLVAAILAGLTGNKRYLAPSALWDLIGGPCVVLSVGAAISGTIVALAGRFDPTSGYTVDMAKLYLGWLVLLMSWYWLSRRIRTIASGAS